MLTFKIVEFLVGVWFSLWIYLDTLKQHHHVWFSSCFFLLLDTCAAQACIEAHGGILCKLTRMIDSMSIESYTYLKSACNADFEVDKASLTAYNCKDKTSIKKGDPPRKGCLEEFQPYSNICGLFALAGSTVSDLPEIHAKLARVSSCVPPAYDWYFKNVRK